MDESTGPGGVYVHTERLNEWGYAMYILYSIPDMVLLSLNWISDINLIRNVIRQ